jgi:multisubunit Na+/H+ antiporter MnhE subunit
LLLVDTASVAELVAGAVAAFIATVATELVRAQHVAEIRWRPALLRGVPRQLAQVPIDLWLLLREVVHSLAGRHRPGRFHSLPFRGGTSPEDDAHRAAIEWFGSLAPNTLVLGVDDDKVIVHQLAARHDARASIEELAP